METLIVVGSILLAIEVVMFVILMLYVKRITTVLSEHNDSNIKQSEVEDRITIYQEKVIELEDINKKLELENKLLQEKISKINKQMKQISDHFKPN
jgi:Tfp pilus assembly protein PilO